MKKRLAIILIVIVGMILASARIAAAKNYATDILPVLIGSQTIRLNLNTVDPILDPARASKTNSFVTNQLFMGLTRVEDGTGIVLPDLATSWEVSPETDVFTFTLRSGATWTDGTPITASGVRDGILRNLADETDAPGADYLFVIKAAEAYHKNEIDLEIMLEDGGIQVVDTTHLRFELNQPAAYFPSILALPVAIPTPFWTIEAHGNFWTEPGNIVTNGPYKLTSWTHGTSLTLTKNPAYFDAEKVKINQVQFSFEEQDKAWEMYLAGQLDSVIVPEEQWNFAKSDSILSQELTSTPNGCTYFYGFNTDKPPFDDVRVRRAFIAVVERQYLINQVLNYAQQPAFTLTPPRIFGHVDGTNEGVGTPYDPELAQQWLAEAGYPGGIGLDMYNLDLVYPNNHFSPHNTQIALYAHLEWLENFGVEVDFGGMDFSDYIHLLFINATPPPSIWAFRTCGNNYADAHAYLSDFLGHTTTKRAFGNWNDAAYLGYIDLAAQNTDLEGRRFLYKLAEKVIVEDEAILLPIFYGAYGIATKPYLTRTYRSDGLGGYIADWSISHALYLPFLVSR